MEKFMDWRTAVGADPERFYKTTLFHSDALLLGLNCLDPSQIQKVHVHEGQDKFYFVLEGIGDFVVGGQTRRAGPGTVVWAPADEPHGVTNRGDERLTMLVGIAPAPTS
jgi:mannose-6-phosphate isomerase-like protein (cupin superfamily)